MQAESVKITVGTNEISIEVLPRVVLQAGFSQVSEETAQKLPKTQLRIGEFSLEDGGVFAGIMRGERGQPDYCLFVPTDETASAILQYGGAGAELTGASSDFDGLANTLALCNSGQDFYAAQFTKELVIGEHNDFYLPARRELSLCYANVPELFETRWHWSSTQYSANFAYVQNFGEGRQNFNHKVTGYRVRAVRRKLIIL